MGVARLDVSNKQWLYVSGCSHLAGSEVVEQGNTARTNEAVGLVWPGLLAKEYELNYITQCMPGASNDYIVRSTMQFVSKWIAQGRDPSELLVVIGWSTNERMEFTHEHDGHTQHYHWANGCDYKSFYKDGQGPNFKNWFKALQLYHTDFDFGMTKRVINITLLDTFLKSVGVEYIQTNSCAKMDQGQWEFLNIEHLKDAFPFETFFEPYDSFVDQYKDDYPEHFSDWLHADAYIHEQYYSKFKSQLAGM